MASGANRIGALPDDLLHHVLSFLPAHEVVATCLLGRRWRHLWKSAPALRVTGVKDCLNLDPLWFIKFVDKLLLHRHPSARLDSFHLDLNELDFSDNLLPDHDTHVNLWFRHALLCGVRLLALRITAGIYTDDDDDDDGWKDLFQLPDVPLISHHLRRLELQMVDLRASNLDFSGCPALVDLKLEMCGINGNISSPFLKHLSITFGYFQGNSSRVRIRLPSLVSLELTDFVRRAPRLESMPLLVSANVRITTNGDSCPNNDHGDCDDHNCHGCYKPDQATIDDGRGESLLLKGLSEVAALELSVGSEVFIINRELKLCPTFFKLKTLLLTEWCPGIAGDLSVLTCFLQRSPILEKLVIQLSKVPKVPVPVEKQGSYSPSEQSSACRYLKIVKIICAQIDERVHKTLNILRPYGVEQADVQTN